MLIEKLETIRVAEHPNLLWVEITGTGGQKGLGETFFGSAAVEAYLHESVAAKLIGRDAGAIDLISDDLRPYLGFASAGVEMRGNSAVDIALWDLLGKRAGLPVAQLLGGFSRPSIRTYNTCAGGNYMRQGEGQTFSNYGVGGKRVQYDDLDAWLTRDAGDLAEELLAEGITAMKIWPFDQAAERNRGSIISSAELTAALVPFEQIRKRVGDQMEIMVEFHSMWRLLPAIKIARALRDFDTFWHEDPIRLDSLGDLARYADESAAPVCASETLGGVANYRDLLATGAAGIVNADLSWCGGITIGRKIAAMADAWNLPFAPHDCTGPVVLAASTHLSLHAPNALLQESVRAYHRTWYADLVSAVPPIENGLITVPEGAGLGLALADDLDRRFTVSRRVAVQR